MYVLSYVFAYLRVFSLISFVFRCLCNVFCLQLNAVRLVVRKMSNTLDVRRFIAEIHNRPALWDVLSDDYNARHQQAHLWKEVSEIVQMDGKAKLKINFI